MKIVPPLSIVYGGTVFESSTIAEPYGTEVQWLVGTTYAISKQKVVDEGRQYENVNVTGNVGKKPKDNPTFWHDIGATNRWAMFELKRNNSSIVTTGPIVVVLDPSERIDTIAVLGLQATYLKIEIFQTDNMAVPPIKTFEYNLTKRNILNWYDYYYQAFGNTPSKITDNIPPFLGMRVRITMNNGATPCGCSSIIMGMSVYAGEVQYGAEEDNLNFSDIVRDADGGAQLFSKPNVPLNNYNVSIKNEVINKLRDTKNKLAGQVALWSGLDELDIDPRYEALLKLGPYTQFKFVFDEFDRSMLVLRIEEISSTD